MTDDKDKGKHVKVISGKRHLGKAGKVFWKKKPIIGIKTKDETIFVDENNCKTV